MLEKLSGKDFYCSFCLRHKYNKYNKNIFVFSFRAIIEKYWDGKTIKTNFNDYDEILAMHKEAVQIALLDPVFDYDPKTMYFFVDFARVGKGRIEILFKI